MFSYARDGALPAAKSIAKVHPRFKTPVNALLAGAVVTALFVLFEFATPTHNVKSCGSPTRATSTCSPR